mmetsp:Transcript_44813/g.93407  ORF Transcript_44813/g.93407 Transcript_44813/m.93407 type:complete len:152 (+) Transcript_44813:66-521(+)
MSATRDPMLATPATASIAARPSAVFAMPVKEASSVGIRHEDGEWDHALCLSYETPSEISHITSEDCRRGSARIQELLGSISAADVSEMKEAATQLEVERCPPTGEGKTSPRGVALMAPRGAGATGVATTPGTSVGGQKRTSNSPRPKAAWK